MPTNTLLASKILMVDDEPSNLQLLENVLAREGYRHLKSLADSRQAGAALRDFQPDILLLDLMMPHLDGFEVMEQVRSQIAPGVFLPILVLTANASNEAKKRALASGATDFLTKPLDVTETLLRIRNLLETRALHLQLRRQNDWLEAQVAQRTAALQRVNRALRVLSEGYLAVIHAEDEISMLETACQQVVNTGGYPLACVSLRTGNDPGHIRPVAVAGIELAELQQLAEQLEAKKDVVCPAAWVMEQRKALVIRNILDQPDYAPYQEMARRFQVNALIAMPLLADDQPLGAFLIYSRESDALDQEEAWLLERLARGLAFGLAALRTEAARRLAQEKIAEQADLLSISKVQDAIFLEDREGGIRYWNDSAKRLYGWSPEEVAGKQAREILYSVNKPEPAEPRTLLAAQGEWRGELIQLTRQGKPVVVDSRWTLIRDKAGHPAGILCVNSDITERKSLERQFLRAQRLESIGRLAGGIAHDLNNVLAPILMGATLLREALTTETNKKLLDSMEQSAQRGADIVKQVLTFARGIEGDRVPLNLRHVVRDLEKIIRETFPKNITLRSVAEPNLWLVKGDATQLHQVLLNLCVNARDAMPAGGVLTVSLANTTLDEVYARMVPDAKPGQFVCLAVTDTGTGIAPEAIEHIFEPFFTTKPPDIGTGLGLATVLGVVKSHGGFVQVETRVGQGTVFRSYFPADTSLKSEPRDTAESSLPHGNGELILVVDDELVVREVADKVLKRYGYRVMTAADGTEALALFVENRRDISLVLCDMMMPNLDGPTTVRALQRMAPQLRIIGISGHGSPTKKEQIRSLNLNGFITKPFGVNRLLETVQTVLKTG